MDHDIERHELEARIAIARDFKRATCGSGFVVPYLFGEKHDPAATPSQYVRLDQRKRHVKAMTPEERKARQKVYDFRIRISRCAIVKEKNGGIVGVYEYFRNGLKPRWHANTAHGKLTFDCAVTAAEARNRSIDQTTPGYDELKCDLGAVWERWGCACGMHRRGEE